MPNPQVNLRLGQGDVSLLDELATGLSLSRSDTVRFALHQLRRSDPVRRRNAFAESLRERFGADAVLRVELDESFNAFGTVDGQPRTDLYLPTQGARFGDDDFVQVWLGDPDTDDVRLFLGMIPARSGVPLVVPLAELSAGMRPRAVGWFSEAE
jgi:hypothetical protein